MRRLMSRSITGDDIALAENKELGTYSIQVNIHVQGNEEPAQVETRVYVGDRSMR